VSAPRCLLIGAGRVAGGFVAPLLRDAGWEVILVSRSRRVVEKINEGGGLWVRNEADLPKDRWVGEVSAVPLWDPNLPHLAARADLLATAVGASALPDAGPAVARTAGRLRSPRQRDHLREPSARPSFWLLA
jgi:nucleoside-diphosphate-sugar epimerase